jgi:hypothetical protein
MIYRFSQLVNIIPKENSAESSTSGLNRFPDDNCIDFEKSNISIFLPSHQTIYQNRKIKRINAKTVRFYRGQHVKIFLEIHIKHPIAEGASLVLSSPYLTESGHADDPANRGKQLLHRILKLIKWRLCKQREFLLPVPETLLDAQEIHFKSIDAKLNVRTAVIDPKPTPEATGNHHRIAEQVLFRYLQMDKTVDKRKVGPLFLKSGMLNQTNPNDPFLRISLKEKGKSVFHMGLKLPAEFWRRMIFLFARPSYVAFAIHLRGKATEMVKTVTFYRSDAGLVNMSAVVEKQHRAYIKLEFIASNICRIRIAVDEVRKDLKTCGRDHVIMNLRFVDQITNHTLICYIPVKIGSIAAVNTARLKTQYSVNR